MNLNISYNWLKEYVATKKSAKDFARELSLSGPTVDFISESKPNFENVVVAEIKKIAKHPNADKLSLCKVSIGKEELDIVCGAPNISEGQKVPLVLVGGKVGDFEIEKTKIRGVESNGMMCSQKELGLGDDNTGIYILPEYTEVGLPIEKVMPISDYIFDTEVTSNRPDAMSIIGTAREAAAITSEKFLYQEPKPNLKIDKEIKLSVSVKEKDICPRYQAIVMDGVKVEPSPLWMQQRLLSSGFRPINNLVDITNYVLLEFGQPMHVFDYEKLNGHEINVRFAKKGEKILALDGKTYEIGRNNLIIADAKNPVAVAGVMGGELSAANEETKTIVLESANFDQVSVRKTARTLNLHSDSSSLFEKGLSPENTNPALKRAIELVVELAGGKVASKIFDEKSYKAKETKIKLSAEGVEKILGVKIKKDKIKDILEGLGFTISGSKEMEVAVPWWREGDIEGEHDLIEEVARIYGYHKLPSKLPEGEIPASVNHETNFYWSDKVKDILVALGFSENYNYSFISEQLIKDCGLKIEDHIQIANPLTTDFEYMRTSLVPGMLQAVAENESNFEEINIFELSKIYITQGDDLPGEKYKLDIVASGKDKEKSFFELKGSVVALLNKLNVTDYTLETPKDKMFWQEGQELEIKMGDKAVGRFGVIDQEILYLFGIKKSVALADIDFEKLISFSHSRPVYKTLSKFPTIDLDLSMEIDRGVLYQEVVDSIKNLDRLIENISFLSQYHGDKIATDKKALAIRLTYRDNNKTLKLEEAQKAHDKVVKELQKKYNINVR